MHCSLGTHLSSATGPSPGHQPQSPPNLLWGLIPIPGYQQLEPLSDFRPRRRQTLALGALAWVPKGCNRSRASYKSFHLGDWGSRGHRASRGFGWGERPVCGVTHHNRWPRYDFQTLPSSPGHLVSLMLESSCIRALSPHLSPSIPLNEGFVWAPSVRTPAPIPSPRISLLFWATAAHNGALVPLDQVKQG